MDVCLKYVVIFCSAYGDVCVAVIFKIDVIWTFVNFSFVDFGMSIRDRVVLTGIVNLNN